MKTQKFLVEITEPDGDWIGSTILEDEIRDFCNVEDPGRVKVHVLELIEDDF